VQRVPQCVRAECQCRSAYTDVVCSYSSCNAIYSMTCLQCSNTASSKYCSNKCQKAFERATFISNWLSGKVKGNAVRIKSYIREQRGNKCEECGWNKVNETTGIVPVELEHIDGDWTNNKIENLKLLCPNCHSLTSTYRALNRCKVERKYRKRKLS
jgi:hypothetical protein